MFVQLVDFVCACCTESHSGRQLTLGKSRWAASLHIDVLQSCLCS